MPRKILFGVMGQPCESDMVTSLFRIVEAAVDQGHEVVFWTCGGSTALTQRTLQDEKPPNAMAYGAGHDYPTTSRMVRELLRRSRGSLTWAVCRHCMEERGAVSQIDEVKILSASRFARLVKESDVSLMMGIK